MGGEEAEWLGGPWDGDRLILRQGMNHVVMPVMDEMPMMPDLESAKRELSIRTVLVPVTRRHGRAYLIWPKVTS